MKWVKKGLIYGPDERMLWAKHSALTPTPILLNDEIIRVYAGFRDEKGVSRIGYVDVDANNPAKILDVAKKPVLDTGVPGTFDDNGVILGDVLKIGNEYLMYYVGFQLVEKVKFLAFSGLAISDNNGINFRRIRQTPVLDRSDEGLYIRAIHSVIYEGGIWKVWYAIGSGWSYIDNTPYPQYTINYIESKDGINFGLIGTKCIGVVGDEYRIGRPRVYYDNKLNLYKMYYTKGTLKKEYMPGYAESFNGVDWVRKDYEVGIAPSQTGWDSITLCYPCLINYGKNQYMFYNGNDMGKSGFGYAQLEDEL